MTDNVVVLGPAPSHLGPMATRMPEPLQGLRSIGVGLAGCIRILHWPNKRQSVPGNSRKQLLGARANEGALRSALDNKT